MLHIPDDPNGKGYASQGDDRAQQLRLNLGKLKEALNARPLKARARNVRA